ncbi:MAG: NAD(P)H-dependent oxidoreductase [Anaerotignum sp.]|nr:NAD(P)H-dependent oxidoreductase [Anaerotignum sp.]MBR5123316.1 NAD(P)H-dependent oxidoreductase [Anaerotignum sp.]MBR6543121.1 NAD(P)H-dependent oxidoreductase [Anaerotignum sp.]
MKKVLFVDCCIRRGESRSKQLADHFLSEVQKNGEYEVETLCLMDENLSYFSEGFFLQREELLAAGKKDHPRFRYAHQFAEADKIVIAAPFWDLSFPALLKVYVENLCVDGITFHTDEHGLHGLCKADHLVYLTARGAFYTDSPLEQGSRYLEQMATFFGIEKYDCVAAEGLDIGAWPVEELMDKAKVQATEVAKTF